jgi:hypothetical protein
MRTTTQFLLTGYTISRRIFEVFPLRPESRRPIDLTPKIWSEAVAIGIGGDVGLGHESSDSPSTQHHGRPECLVIVGTHSVVHLMIRMDSKPRNE